VPFSLEAFLEALKKRLDARGHAVIVVGEGAGQDLMKRPLEKDVSGNIKLGDVGIFLKDQIKSYFDKSGDEVNLKYIDPSYIIRSVPANPSDSAFCLVLGHDAVHAGMTGRTNMLVGTINSRTCRFRWRYPNGSRSIPIVDYGAMSSPARDNRRIYNEPCG
jgi:6-phosphofructokinase 1